MKSLFIAEKPSVAMEFAKALKMKSSKKDGYIEDDDNIVTWCVGHLVCMSYPEKYDPDLKKWSLDTLPFIPESYKYEIIPNVLKQFKVVSNLLNRKDVGKIYYSGDSAREGEYIQRLVRMYGGYNKSAEEYRVWIDSQTEEEILNGITNAKPLSAYDNLSDSAYARAIEDYLIGINFSRALSIKYANLISSAAGVKQPIAVGRVMSCVLGMIVERERLIRNTKSIPFYGIKADFLEDLNADWKIVKGSKYFEHKDAYKDVGMLKKELTEDLINELTKVGTLTVKDKKDSTEKKSAPLLFNLAELQGECTKQFHISPSDTLKIAQSLYEKKLTTYPRTDARVLTTAICKVIDDNIKGLSKVMEISAFADEIIKNKMYQKLSTTTTKYVDDSAVSDHYAIIPTGQGFSSLSSLSSMEKNVYLLICKRFLSIFYDEAVFDKLTVTYEQGNETFCSHYTALIKEGFYKVAGHKDDTDIINTMKKVRALSGTFDASFSIKEGASQPPKRYTTGSLVLAMENAGNLIEDDELREQIKGSGIGTSATRAETISKLIKINYIKVNAKTQIITPDKLGELVYDVLNSALKPILNPQYTASWEKGLASIEKGDVTKQEYLDKINSYVQNGVNVMKQNDLTNEIKESIKSLKSVYKDLGEPTGSVSITTCPICGKDIKEGPKGFYCSGYRDGCKFSIYKTPFGKKLTEKNVVEMCESMTTSDNNLYSSKDIGPIYGFVSKKGNTFGATIKLNYDNSEGKSNFEIVEFAKRKK